MKQNSEKSKSSSVKKKLILIISVIMTGLIITGIIVANRTKTQIREVFQLNEKMKNEGYYLSEFEFKMLGIAYYLDHGHYLKAFSRLNKIHQELSTGEGLIKVPEFSSSKEKLEFYKKLQNPQTGAFMDDAYPLFTYFGVTANMIAYIEDLSKIANESFRLQYPLKFLDQINTPEKLIELVDDLSTVGWLGAKFKTPYVEIGELWSLAEDAERLGIYSFSPEWKQVYLQWCYDNQDEETGLWGSRLRTNNKLLNGGDLTDSEKMIKKFIASNGNEIYPDFPLRYRDKMFKTALDKLSVPMPTDLDELHEWILNKNRGIRFLTRYLWKNASLENKAATRRLIEKFISIRFDNYYIKNEGAFSLYPNAKTADLDGVGEAIGMFRDLGTLSDEKQKRLWGDPKENIIDLGTHAVSEVKASDLATMTRYPNINSIRLYKIEPTSHFIENVEGVFYPQETNVLDIVDLLPKLKEWVRMTPQNMGNWVTKEDILNNLADVNIQPVPVSKEIPLESANQILKNNSKVILIGFDVLQIPGYKIAFTLKKKS